MPGKKGSNTKTRRIHLGGERTRPKAKALGRMIVRQSLVLSGGRVARFV
jgi:hypothetical protein